MGLQTVREIQISMIVERWSALELAGDEVIDDDDDDDHKDESEQHFSWIANV